MALKWLGVLLIAQRQTQGAFDLWPCSVGRSDGMLSTCRWVEMLGQAGNTLQPPTIDSPFDVAAAYKITACSELGLALEIHTDSLHPHTPLHPDPTPHPSPQCQHLPLLVTVPNVSAGITYRLPLTCKWCMISTFCFHFPNARIQHVTRGINLPLVCCHGNH